MTTADHIRVILGGRVRVPAREICDLLHLKGIKCSPREVAGIASESRKHPSNNNLPILGSKAKGGYYLGQTLQANKLWYNESLKTVLNELDQLRPMKRFMQTFGGQGELEL